MFECAGWLVAAPGDDADELTTSESYRMVQEQLRLLLPQIETLFSAHHIEWLNGSCFVQLAVDRNHGAGKVPAIVQLLRNVMTVLPGTYGVLHYRDDELDDHPETFRAIHAGSGQVQESADAVLTRLAPS